MKIIGQFFDIFFINGQKLDKNMLKLDRNVQEYQNTISTKVEHLFVGFVMIYKKYVNIFSKLPKRNVAVFSWSKNKY